MQADSLASRLYGALFKRIGSDQHLEIASFLQEAQKISVDPAAAESLRKIANEYPWTIESNLDAAAWPDKPTWYEIKIGSRLGNQIDNGTTGFLVLPHPAGPGMYMVLTAFENEGISAQHCFAVALINITDFVENAYRARVFYSKTPAESLERLMSFVGVSITDEFEQELLVVEDGNSEIVEAALRDAALEIPLFLAILVAQNTKNGFIKEFIHEGDQIHLNLQSLPKSDRTSIGKLSDKLNRRQSSGFIRFPKRNQSVELRWYN